MTVMVVEVLLGVGGFDVDRGAEMTMFQKSDMGGGSVPGEVDGIPNVELFKEISEGARPMGQSRNMSSISLNHRLCLSSCEPRKFCSRWPMNRLALEWAMDSIQQIYVTNQTPLSQTFRTVIQRSQASF